MLLLHSNTTRSAVPSHARSARQSPCHQVHGQDVTSGIPQVRLRAETMLDAVQTAQTAWGLAAPSKYMSFLKEARQQTLEWEGRHPQEGHRGYPWEALLAAQDEP